MLRLLVSLCVFLCVSPAMAKERVNLLHVSYDATRELLADYNRAFIRDYEARYGVKPKLRMSFGGSGKQARSVMDGLKADIVSLALAYDVDAIAERTHLLSENWQDALPQHSSPFYSTIVFLVRSGNPKRIRDWGDLARSDIQVLTPNPKSSGGARWGYLAAWGYAEQRYGKNSEGAKSFMHSWLSRVPVFDTGARAATTNFVRRNQGDVLITWENEAHLAQKYFGKERFDIIQPSVTIKAEPVVAILRDSPAARRYVNGLFSSRAQALAVQHFFRTSEVADRSVLPSLQGVRVLTIRDFGDWQNAQADHFAHGGLFEQLTARKP